MPDPVRGEVWRVNFDPTVGAEIRKVRPAVVVNDETIGRLPLRMVVPITEWSDSYAAYPWMTHLSLDASNGLTKTSAADAFQMRSLSLLRFVDRIGRLSETDLDAIVDAIGLCVKIKLTP